MMSPPPKKWKRRRKKGDNSQDHDETRVTVKRGALAPYDPEVTTPSSLNPEDISQSMRRGALAPHDHEIVAFVFSNSDQPLRRVPPRSTQVPLRRRPAPLRSPRNTSANMSIQECTSAPRKHVIAPTSRHMKEPSQQETKRDASASHPQLSPSLVWAGKSMWKDAPASLNEHALAQSFSEDSKEIQHPPLQGNGAIALSTVNRDSQIRNAFEWKAQYAPTISSEFQEEDQVGAALPLQQDTSHAEV